MSPKHSGTSRQQISDSLPWAVWFTGLPGCGKSSTAERVVQSLSKRGIEVVLLQMDKERRRFLAHSKYAEAERDLAYRLFADKAAAHIRDGDNVVLDGSAYRKQWRDYARMLIPRFAEIHIHCSLEVAIKREDSRPKGLVIAGLYKKALERKRTGRDFQGLGQVIGVDVQFEHDENAECIIDNDKLTEAQTASRALAFLEKFAGL